MNEPYYIGGYNIYKLKPIRFGALKGKIFYTACNEINFQIFDTWCQPWVNDNLSESEKLELNLNNSKIEEIHNWTKEKFDNLPNLFQSIKSTLEFKSLFLNNLSDLKILSINFSEKYATSLINDFQEGKNLDTFNFNNGNFCLRLNLKEKIYENTKEQFLGFDIVGVDCDGSIVSFTLLNSDVELKDKFHLKFNEFGLFSEIKNADKVLSYFNERESIPFYICKVKMLNLSQ